MHIWIIHITIKLHNYCSTSSYLPYWVWEQGNVCTDNKQSKYSLSMCRLYEWPNHTHAALIMRKWKEPVYMEKTPQICKWWCSVTLQSTLYSWNFNSKMHWLETLLTKSFPSKSILLSHNVLKQLKAHQYLSFLIKVLCYV